MRQLSTQSFIRSTTFQQVTRCPRVWDGAVEHTALRSPPLPAPGPGRTCRHGPLAGCEANLMGSAEEEEEEEEEELTAQDEGEWKLWGRLP